MNVENIVKDIIMSGVKEAGPENLLRSKVVKKGDKIYIEGKEFDLSNYDEILVFGIGKASKAMAKGLEDIGIYPDKGLLIPKKGDSNSTETSIPIREAYHPYPENKNYKAAQEILNILKGSENAFIIFLVSGGGSALFCMPENNIKVKDMNKINQLLVKSGASIHEINTVRKHISRVKGGRFARICQEKGYLVSLIISDVVGDDLSVIASGPTYPDKTTFNDAVYVLKGYNIWKKTPKRIKKYLVKGKKGNVEETPEKVEANNYLIGNNLTALRGAKSKANQHGFNSLILTSQNKGEAKTVAKSLISIAKEIKSSQNPVSPPATLIIGGEMTVKIASTKEKNKGGPNREFVLSSALEITNEKNIHVASVDTDGEDGLGKSGAYANTNTIKNPETAKKYLFEHKTQKFFDQKNQSINFKSKTNVNDLSIILIKE